MSEIIYVLILAGIIGAVIWIDRQLDPEDTDPGLEPFEKRVGDFYGKIT